MEEEWGKPRWRTKLGAAGLAVVLALVSFFVVSKVWRYGAPARPPAGAAQRAPVPASPVEVMLVPARPNFTQPTASAPVRR